MLLVLGALWWDLRDAATEPYPVAARTIPAGTRLTGLDVAYAEVPVGSLAVPDLEDATAARTIADGEAITGAAITTGPQPPPGWWTVPVHVGALAVPGDEVLLVISDPPYTTQGMIVTGQRGDRFDLDYQPAAVAVPAADAALIAAAEREGKLVTAARPGQDGQ